MMSNTTGRALSELEHLRQSITDILTTPIGTRLHRRAYGSLLPELIDHPGNGSTLVKVYAAVAGALMTWEPRLRVSRVQMYAGERPGQWVIDLEGLYSPLNQKRSVLSLRLPLQVGSAA